MITVTIFLTFKYFIMLHHKKLNNQLFVAFVTMLLLTSCQTYYKASQVQKNNPASEAATIDSLRLSERYFILQNGTESFYMKDPTITADQKIMDCILDSVPFYHQIYLANGPSGKMEYLKNTTMGNMVLNEVHIHIQPDNTAVIGPYAFPLDKIQRIEVIEKDKQRTTNSFLWGTLGIALGITAVFFLVELLSALPRF